MRLTKRQIWNIVLILGIVVSNLLTVFFLFWDNDENVRKINFPMPDKIILRYKDEVISIERSESYFEEIVELNQLRADIVEYFVKANDNGKYLVDDFYLEYCYEEPNNILVETKLERKYYIVSKLCFILTGEQNNCIRIYSNNGDILDTVGQLNSNTELLQLCVKLITG